MNAMLAALLVVPAVVMYHRVDAWAPSDPISHRLTISPTQFAGELREIARSGRHTMGIGELARAAVHGESPRGAVLLTFDDGYSDQFRYAFPILQRFGDRAIFFVNTGTIGTPGHLTWGQVQAMERAGMSIECHGVDHDDLGLMSLERQTYEVDGCVQALREHLGGSVLAFAYPSGDFDAATIDLERRAGVRFAFTTDPRFQRDARSPYEIVRIRVTNGMSDEKFSKLLKETRSYVNVSL